MLPSLRARLAPATPGSVPRCTPSPASCSKPPSAAPKAAAPTTAATSPSGTIAAGSAGRCSAVQIEPPNWPTVAVLVELALAGDAAYDDITTLATVPADLEGHATFLAKAP